MHVWEQLWWVYWGRDVVGLPVVQLVNKFERNRFFGVESCCEFLDGLERGVVYVGIR